MKSTNLHRIDASLLESERAVAIKGNVEQRMPIEYAEPEPNRFTAAWDAYKAHRAHSRIDGIRHAIRALRLAN